MVCTRSAVVGDTDCDAALHGSQTQSLMAPVIERVLQRARGTCRDSRSAHALHNSTSDDLCMRPTERLDTTRARTSAQGTVATIAVRNGHTTSMGLMERSVRCCCDEQTICAGPPWCTSAVQSTLQPIRSARRTVCGLCQPGSTLDQQHGRNHALHTDLHTSHANSAASGPGILCFRHLGGICPCSRRYIP